MPTIVRVVVGVLLVAHGLVHLLYVADDVEVFSLEDSWLIPRSAARGVGLVLMLGTVGAFAILGLAVWGVPALSGAWPVLTLIAAGISLVLLVAFWNIQLVVGVAIDVALLVIAGLRP